MNGRGGHDLEVAADVGLPPAAALDAFDRLSHGASYGRLMSLALEQGVAIVDLAPDGPVADDHVALHLELRGSGRTRHVATAHLLPGDHGTTTLLVRARRSRLRSARRRGEFLTLADDAIRTLARRIVEAAAGDADGSSPRT